MAVRVIAILLCALALAASEVEIRIASETFVTAPRATLGDVAGITAEAELGGRLRALVIADLPTLTPVQVDARLVTALAARAAAPATLRIVGSGSVARRPHTFGDADLYAAAAAVVPGARTVAVRCSGALTVPEGAGLVAEVLDAQAVGEVPFRVRALEEGRETGRALVVLRVEREIAVVVAVRDLVHGTVLGAGDVRCERRLATRANLPAAVDPATLVGGIVRRDLVAGALVPPSLVAPCPAVRAGTTVTALWPGRGFSVELQATALGDARAGERVGVRRLGDRVVLTCIAQADGTVLVQP
jgi:flagella basal body P-ring formation protein FlgA